MMLNFIAVAAAQARKLPIDFNFPDCMICGRCLCDTFDTHEDNCGNSICDECFRYRLPRKRIEKTPDRFRPQANFYTKQSDAGDDESREKEVFINE